MSEIMNHQKIFKVSTEIRKHIIKMCHKSKSPHVGTSMSCADILSVLYFDSLRVDPQNPLHPERDRFILSKGHGSAALYSTLAHRGFFPISKLEEFYSDGSKMAGHPTLQCVPGVEATTGSLGHGLPLACGISYNSKIINKPYRVFVLISDGECDEGTTWEAALFAGFHGLDNLTVIIDYNKIQSFGNVREVLDLEPLAKKWESFGWSVKEVDGHDILEMTKTFKEVPFEMKKPSLVIAHTIKGKGVSYMENKLEWHYKSPTEDEYKKGVEELEKNENSIR
jgi:transketolase